MNDTKRLRGAMDQQFSCCSFAVQGQATRVIAVRTAAIATCRGSLHRNCSSVASQPAEQAMMKTLKEQFRRVLDTGRQREGLTVKRISALCAKARSGTDTPGLLESELVVKLATSLQVSVEEALLRYVEAVVTRLPEQHRSPAGLALNISPKSSRHLMERRGDAAKALCVSETTYRDTKEDPALACLVDLLVRPTREDLRALKVEDREFTGLLEIPAEAARDKAASVVVLGAAVMDLNFVVSTMPDFGESTQALRFEANPGGKGLTQAVACARLGMKTQLISAVGDDAFGDRILEYLRSESVDSTLVQRRKGAKTAVTGVFTKNGRSMAIGWKNSTELGIDSHLLATDALKHALSRSDFFLSSFEFPSGVVEPCLLEAKRHNATTIITPAPPYGGDLLASKHRRHIDFLVANAWEASQLVSEHLESNEEAFAKLARRLIVQDRIRNVMITLHQDCLAYMAPENGGLDIKALRIAGHGHISESAGARDAFCAMLARKLHEDGRHSVDSAAKWATAAMNCVQAETSVPDSMPSLGAVAPFVEETSLHSQSLAGTNQVNRPSSQE